MSMVGVGQEIGAVEDAVIHPVSEFWPAATVPKLAVIACALLSVASTVASPALLTLTSWGLSAAQVAMLVRFWVLPSL